MVVRYPSSRFHFGEGERINLDKKEVHQMRTKHCLASLGHLNGNSTSILTGAGTTNGPPAITLTGAAAAGAITDLI